MKLAILAFTRRGCDLARRIEAAMAPGQCRRFTMAKFSLPDFESIGSPLADFVDPVFHWADVMVFVGSAGVAVRAIAPWVADKKTDPAVLVCDEAGSFVISLLSGHIGGGNDAARSLAAAIGAVPVITTATDVNGKFAVDAWAAKNGAVIDSMAMAKAAAAEILERDIPIKCDFPIVSDLPGGTILGESGDLGIYIGIRKEAPFTRTLHLIPKVLQLGIGCRRGTSAAQINAAVTEVLARNNLDRRAVCAAASIDLKADEPGLLDFCRDWHLPVNFYSAEELLAVPGQFPASNFVKNITGVDNVCQRAASIGAETIIVEKTAMDGVTVAVAAKKWEAVF